MLIEQRRARFPNANACIDPAKTNSVATGDNVSSVNPDGDMMDVGAPEQYAYVEPDDDNCNESDERYNEKMTAIIN